MADFTLYYWPIPFRGQFAKALLAYKGVAYEQPPASAIAPLRAAPPSEADAIFMAPPLLHDKATDTYISQNGAIFFYLAAKLDLLPAGLAQQATALKLLLDANDVLDEITLHCGHYKMWELKEWREFRDGRFAKWLQLFEAQGKRAGLTAEAGNYLGGEAVTAADLALWALLATMDKALPALRPVLRAHAPCCMAMCERLTAGSPGLKALLEGQSEDVYCGGQIGASLAKVVAAADA